MDDDSVFYKKLPKVVSEHFNVLVVYEKKKMSSEELLCSDTKLYLPERFLVAIDRRNGTEVAMETVKLAEEFMLSSGGLVLGIDLSGDPKTDDKGVFCTDLSQEYQLAASTFSLSPDAVWELSERAVDCIFAGEAVKQQLKQKWTEIKPGLLK
ncbi:hypothetical protein XENOCAPTIV_029968 [Xenoophorus captivus]|uniref:Uncharacterized protein n=1 Tax=Xenoophorus captivus TaxID=1517983 RepID=A0ABV0QCT8_9TELE